MQFGDLDKPAQFTQRQHKTRKLFGVAMNMMLEFMITNGEAVLRLLTTVEISKEHTLEQLITTSSSTEFQQKNLDLMQVNLISAYPMFLVKLENTRIP